jgi:hypothetical protein
VSRVRNPAVSTFKHRTIRRYNTTRCSYGVNEQHKVSISELHCAIKVFFFARASTVQALLQRQQANYINASAVSVLPLFEPAGHYIG